MPGKIGRPGFSLTYMGKVYPNIAALHRDWGDDKPSLENLNQKVLRWRKRNPSKEIDDAVIEVLLATRSGANWLRFQGVWYSGPTALHRAAPDPKISRAGFWLRLNEFREKWPGIELSDPVIGQFLAPEETFSYRGHVYPSMPTLHASIPAPKVKFAMFMIRYREWKKTNPSKTLTENDIDDIARREERIAPFRVGEAIYRSMIAYYDTVPHPKCSYVRFAKRFKKLAPCHVTEDDQRQLFRNDHGRLPFTRGFLYRVVHLRSGKSYIGITAQEVMERWRMHLRDAAADVSKNPLSLQVAIAADGAGAFRVEKLAVYYDLDELLQAEKSAIQTFATLSPSGFNLNYGGFGWSSRGTEIEYEGQRYPTLAALARAFGISEKLLDGRRRWNWPLSDALTRPCKSRSRHDVPVTVQNNQFPNIKAAANSYGVSYKAAAARLKAGWATEEVFGIAKHLRRRKRSLVCKGRADALLMVDVLPTCERQNDFASS